MVAMIIDGLDGPLARKFDVSTHVPRIDGNVMDLIIDYVTCVVAPAFFMHEFGLLPGGGLQPGRHGPDPGHLALPVLQHRDPDRRQLLTGSPPCGTWWSR